MKTPETISLSENQQTALEELRRRQFGMIDVQSVILFGSVARGEANEESDIDILIITEKPLTRPDRHKITDEIFEINLMFGTNFSSLVVDHDSWENGTFSVLPLREEVMRDGIVL